MAVQARLHLDQGGGRQSAKAVQLGGGTGTTQPEAVGYKGYKCVFYMRFIYT